MLMPLAHYIDCCKSVISGIACPPTLFFFKIVFVVIDTVYFSINIKTGFSASVKSLVGL